jgi:hypothetical protein
MRAETPRLASKPTIFCKHKVYEVVTCNNGNMYITCHGNSYILYIFKIEKKTPKYHLSQNYQFPKYIC